MINTQGIRWKMLKAVVAVLTVVFILLYFIVNGSVKELLIENNSEYMATITKSISTEVEEKLNSNLLILKVLAENPMLSDPNVSWEVKKQVLDENVENYGQERIVLIDKEGNALGNDGLSFDASEREDFKQAIKGNDYISEPYFSELLKDKLLIGYSTPLKSQGEIVGVLLSIRDGYEFTDIIENSSMPAHLEGNIVGKTGTTIASPNKEDVQGASNLIDISKENSEYKDLAYIIQSMISGGEGIDSYKLNGQKKYIAYTPIDLTGWSFSVNISEDDLISVMSRLKLTVAIIMVVALLISGTLGYFLTNILSKKLIILRNYVETFATGDFTIKPDSSLDSKSEIGEIYRALNNSRASITGIVNSVKGTSTLISDSCSELSSISGDLVSMSNNISLATKETAEDTTNQSEKLMEVSDIVRVFTEKVNEISNKIFEINGMSGSIQEKTAVSNKDMMELVKTLAEFNERFEGFAVSMDEMKDKFRAVNDMTELINSISDQTNLLALNASIEAARAGEAGKGFAVVAEEIRKLSEESRSSTEKISTVLGEVVHKTEDIDKNVGEMNAQLSEQKKIVDKTRASFKAIDELVENIVPMIGDITENTNSLIKANEDIERNIDESSSISQGLAAASEEISASTETMDESSRAVADSADSLLVQVNEMIERVNEFKTEE